MGATRPFRQAGEMWCSEDSESPAAPRSGGRGEASLHRRRLRLLLLEAPDQVGDVGRLLLQVALVLLQAPEQRLGVGKAATAAVATAVMSPSVHSIHLLSPS